MTDQIPYMCPYCHIGHCQPGHANYVRMVGTGMVSVPEVLTWSCDVCGYQEFDRDAVLRIEALIGHSEPPRGHERSASKRSAPDSKDKDNARRLKP